MKSEQERPASAWAGDKETHHERVLSSSRKHPMKGQGQQLRGQNLHFAKTTLLYREGSEGVKKGSQERKITAMIWIKRERAKTRMAERGEWERGHASNVSFKMIT